MKKLSTLCTILSATITGYIFWILFVFNGRFIAKNSHEPMAKVNEYAASGGNLHFTILLIISLIFAVCFITYAYKDSHNVELYDDGVNPVDFQENNNLFSNKRKIQYVLLVVLITEILSLLIKMNTMSHDLDYVSIFNKDGLFLFGIEFIFVYFIIFTYLLFHEMVSVNKKNYHN